MPLSSPLRRENAPNGIPRLAILDQTRLPHATHWLPLAHWREAETAIRAMQVRGAPLIGITAAYGLALAMQEDASDTQLVEVTARLAATRPTAVNLRWALARMRACLQTLTPAARRNAAWAEADALAAEDAARNHAIGQHGLALLRALPRPGARPLRVMTHCNAGWLATAGGGTALAPVYAARAAGIPLEVWVSETRPRNQGLLTAWELREADVPHTVIADNAAGILMAQGKVDAIFVGADRIAANGDVANKVGTLLKALAARRFGLPFYVAAPTSTFDAACANATDIPIEERDGDEVRCVTGMNTAGQPVTARLLPEHTAVNNIAFDLTPADLVTAFVTERSVFAAEAAALRPLFAEPEHD
ncbi:MAG: S-methyl-5-thioribose-1-phosphate isomerase [Zoogloeaceae bacterium]|nr:S-methyl-5-thioribose-1-phosphate isomerase [Zoogloeaceae bacterium]